MHRLYHRLSDRLVALGLLTTAADPISNPSRVSILIKYFPGPDYLLVYYISINRNQRLLTCHD